MNLGGRIINPGELREKVTLLSRTVSTETGGFQTPAWTVLAQVWARWQNVHGSEVWAAQAAQASEPATVLIRYREGLIPTGAIVLGWVDTEDVNEADVYEIVSLDDILRRHEYIEIKVKRTGAG